LYNNFYNANYADPAYQLMRKRTEKLDLRRLGHCAGACVIAYIVIQYAIRNILGLIWQLTEIDLTENYYDLLMAAVLLASVFLPFFLIYRRMEPEEKTASMQFGAPKSKPMMFAAVLAGLMLCFAGNYAASFFVMFLENLGFSLTGGEYAIPSDVQGLIMTALTVAVIPAFVEEFAMRGVVMQPLRRYGDRFALVISSLVFALMHGNLIQIPFALIAGTAIGYFAISTGTIWTGVIIHLLNNLSSVVLSYLYDVRPTLYEKVSVIMTIAVFVVGLVSLFIYGIAKNKYRLQRQPSYLTGGQKTAAYTFSAMIAAVICIIIETAKTVEFIG